MFEVIVPGKQTQRLHPFLGIAVLILLVLNDTERNYWTIFNLIILLDLSVTIYYL